MNEDTPAEPVRPTVFLSYARADQDRAAQLVMALEAAGLSLWWDARIEGGAAFAKSIEAALEECDAVIVVWSAKSSAPTGCLTRPRRARPAQARAGLVRRHGSAAGISPVSIPQPCPLEGSPMPRRSRTSSAASRRRRASRNTGAAFAAGAPLRISSRPLVGAAGVASRGGRPVAWRQGCSAAAGPPEQRRRPAIQEPER